MCGKSSLDHTKVRIPNENSHNDVEAWIYDGGTLKADFVMEARFTHGDWVVGAIRAAWNEAW